MIFEINLHSLTGDESVMFWNLIETGKCKAYTQPHNPSTASHITVDQYRTLLETMDASNTWQSNQ